MEQLGAVEVRVTDAESPSGAESIAGLMKVKAEAAMIGAAVGKAVSEAFKQAGARPMPSGAAAGGSGAAAEAGGGNRVLVLGQMGALARRTRIGGALAGAAGRATSAASAAGISGSMLLAVGGVAALGAAAGIAAKVMSKMAAATERNIDRFASLNPVVAGIAASMQIQQFGLDMLQSSFNAGAYRRFAESKMSLQRTAFPITASWDRISASAGTTWNQIKEFFLAPIAGAVEGFRDPGAEAAYRAAKVMQDNAKASGNATDQRMADAQMRIAAEMGSLNARASLASAAATVEGMNRLFLEDFDILSGGSSNWAMNMIDSRMAGPRTAPVLPDIFGGGTANTGG
jgi:hypothetical protein